MRCCWWAPRRSCRPPPSTQGSLRTQTLLIAKLAKLNERLGGGRPDRILAKDASDILRILRYLDASSIGAGLAAFLANGVAMEVIGSSLEFFREQLNARSSPMIDLASEHHEQFETPAQIDASFRTLGQRLLHASTPE